MTGPDRATAVTRIARRKVILGHERDYEQLVCEMFALMLAIWFLTPVLQRLGLPFLVITAINVVVIVGCMIFLVAPVLTKLMKWFLVPDADR